MISCKLVFPKEIPLHEQRDEWRAKYTFKYENGKTIIEIIAEDSTAFRALINELTRYFIASEKIDKLVEKFL